MIRDITTAFQEQDIQSLAYIPVFEWAAIKKKRFIN